MTIRNTAILAMTASLALAGIGAPAASAQNQNRTVISSGETQPSSARTSRRAARSNERICVDVELTGTRMKRRVCQTQAEWEQQGGLPTD